MNQYHRLTNLYFQDNWLVLTIDGEEKKYAIQEISPALTKASEEERNNFEISPSGLGLCRLNENAPVLRPSVRNCIRKFPKPLLEQGNLIQEALSLYQRQ